MIESALLTDIKNMYFYYNRTKSMKLESNVLLSWFTVVQHMMMANFYSLNKWIFKCTKSSGNEHKY